jgi:lysophospholipase L1-like esterase
VNRFRPLAANVGLGIFVLALCLGLLEGAARLSAALEPAGASGTPIARFHPTLGWDKPPGGEQFIRRPEYAVWIRLNTHGLRGPDREYGKPPGTRRVLILGDSFAQGYYVAEEDSARAVLERQLDSGNCGRHEVLNGGTPGYSTDQEYLFYGSEGRRYQPDLVVLFFFFNDLYYNTRAIGTGGKGKPYFDLDGERLLLQNSPVPPPPEAPAETPDGTPRRRVAPWKGSVALRLLSDRTARTNPPLHRALARLGLVEPISIDPPEEFWPFCAGSRLEERAVEDMWRRTRAILRTLRAEVESDGARLAILYVPVRFEVNESAWRFTKERYRPTRAWERDRVIARLRSVAGELGIPLLDLRAPLQREDAAGRAPYFPRDGHWNEVGNAVAARELAAFASQALPCPGAP